MLLYVTNIALMYSILFYEYTKFVYSTVDGWVISSLELLQIILL